jgi:hypothetical protein
MSDLRELREDLLASSVAIGCPLESWRAEALALERRTTALVAPRQPGKSRALAVLALWWAADSARFANLRAASWWGARETFRRGEVDLDPEDRDRASQLAAVRSRWTRRGAF